MILIDANLLLYASDSESPFHAAAHGWLRSVLGSVGPVGFAWVTLLAFLRISTHSRITRRPLTPTEASEVVGSWLELENVLVVEPGERYWRIFEGFLTRDQCTGPLVMDAHLAALAIEHGAVLYTSDRDFARFEGLRFVNPLAGSR